MSFYITKKTRHWSIFCKNRHSLKQKSGTDWKKQELIKKIKIKRYRVEDLEEEKNWHIYGCSVTQAVFSPSAALCQLIKTGNIFLSCVREAAEGPGVPTERDCRAKACGVNGVN